MLKQLLAIGFAAFGLAAGISAAAAEPVDPRIVGGEIAATGRWPQQVSIQYQLSDQSWAHSCGGTVAGSTKILTAAHCFFDSAGNYVGDTRTYSVMVGTNLNDRGTRIAVTQVDTHAAYNNASKDNDIAILTLGAATTQPPSVLTTAATDRLWRTDGVTLTTIGWGNNAPSSLSPAGFYPVNLYQVDVQAINFATCNTAYGGALTDNMICAGNAAFTKDSCQGDSGGPIFVGDGQGRSVQTGVVSWGRGCAQSPYPGVYTKLANYTDWVRTRVPDALFATTVQSGWYYAPASAGSGYAIEIRGNNLFMAVLAYTAAGAPVWYSSTGAMASATNYSGQLVQWQGGPALNGLSGGTATPVGNAATVQLNFTGNSTATLQIGANTYVIQRFPLVNGTVAATPLNLPETGWYYNAAAPGGGVFVEVQGQAGYAGFITYDNNGQATWTVMYQTSGVGSVPPASEITAPLAACQNGPVLGGAGQQPTCQNASSNSDLTFSLPFAPVFASESLNVVTTLTRMRF